MYAIYALHAEDIAPGANSRTRIAPRRGAGVINKRTELFGWAGVPPQSRKRHAQS